MADRLLLDTHVVLWWLFDSPNLTEAVDHLVRSAPEVRVSAASAWEIAIQQALGRLDVPEPLEDAVRRSGFLPLAIAFEHAQLVSRLPLLHRDPFDRLLVAVALAEGLTLVTADEAVLAYPVASFDGLAGRRAVRGDLARLPAPVEAGEGRRGVPAPGLAGDAAPGAGRDRAALASVAVTPSGGS